MPPSGQWFSCSSLSKAIPQGKLSYKYNYLSMRELNFNKGIITNFY